MKLLKPSGCSFPGGGGNVKKLTTLVEGQGIGFRTRVRLPSSPLMEMLESIDFSAFPFLIQREKVYRYSHEEVDY